MPYSVKPPIAEFRNVTKTYLAGHFPRVTVPALREVSVAIPAESVCGLIGPNRAGKSTLVKLLLSLSHASAGTVLRMGRDVGDRHTLARCGYVHDCQAFPAYLSARQVLEYYGTLGGCTRQTLQDSIPELLLDVGLDDRADEPIRTFSKGMLQRLALAQALVNDPELLVLDEPAEGMDLFGRERLRQIVRRRRESGRSVLLVSHSLAEVESCCDHIIVLRAGSVVFHGPIDQLVGHSEETDLSSAVQPLYAESVS